ncbi:MAG: hypothetical protein HWE27_05570 [Gammaproteobacteria bacterium]|nr:hypothetical protein [Gammaproteobacteria bacterium]
MLIRISLLLVVLFSYSASHSINDFSGNSLDNSQPAIIENKSKLSKTDDSLWGYSSKGRELFEVTTSSGEIITLVDVDGLAYSGDMIIGRTESLKENGLKIVTGQEFPESDEIGPLGVTRYPSSGYKWPNGVVPYVYASNLTSDAREAMNYAISHWNSRTNLRFVQRTNQSDYITVRDGGGCSSYVGKQGGSQTVTLARGCGRGAAVHELGHAIGFWHEQTRTDRDNYVTIYWNNIQPDARFNFEKISSRDGTNFGDYDFRSIMHYRTNAFGINGARTIWPKVGGVDTDYMGRGTQLSQGDLAAAASIYGGGTNPPPPPSNPTIKTSKSTFLDNENIMVSFSGASGDAYDWIGLYRQGGQNSEYINWQYLNGATNGSRQFAPLPEGNYEARLFFNDSYNVEATVRFSVESTGQSGPTLRPAKSTFSSRENIVIEFRNSAGNEYDWIGLYQRGDENSEYISWRYLRQRRDGSVSLPALPAGNYSARLFFNDSYRLEVQVDFRVVDN